MSTVIEATENLSGDDLLWCANELNRYTDRWDDPGSRYVVKPDSIMKYLPDGGCKQVTSVAIEERFNPGLPAVFPSKETEVMEERDFGFEDPVDCR